MYFKSLFRRIKRLIKHFRFGLQLFKYSFSIWFCGEDIYPLIKMVLENIKKEFEEDKDSNKEIYKEIKICLALLDRIIEDDYFNCIKQYELKELGIEDGGYEFVPVDEKEELFKMVHRYNRNGVRLSEKEAYKIQKYLYGFHYKKSNNIRKSDLRLLFKILSNKLHLFWT